MDVLVYLVERAGAAVTNEELLNAFWIPGVSSTNAVHKSVAELRQAFGDDRHQARYIETVHKRGYRLVAEVARLTTPLGTLNWSAESCASNGNGSPSAEAVVDAAEMTASSMPKPRRHVVLLVLTMAVVVATSVAMFWKGEGTRAAFLTLDGRSAVLVRGQNEPGSDERSELVRAIHDGMVERLVQQGATVGVVQLPSTSTVEVTSAPGADYVVTFDVVDMQKTLRGSITMLAASPERPSYRERYEQADLNPRNFVAEMVSRASEDLAILLDDEQVARMKSQGARDVRAYRLAREADAFKRITTVESLNRAVDLYREAIRIAPSYSYVYEELAGAYWSIALTPPDNATRESARRGLQALARDAKTALADASVAADVDRRYRMVSVGSAFDSEALWRQELLANPDDIEALRRYGELLRGAKLIDESEQYLQRATSLAMRLGDGDTVDAIGPQYAPIAGIRGDLERAIAIRKVSVEKFPDFTVALFSLVLNLTKQGHYAEADVYLTRLRSSDSAWAWAAETMMRAERGEFAKGSSALQGVLDDPRTNNATRGWLCFAVGDVECGVRYWRDMEAAFLPLQWLATPEEEQYWAPGVVEDARYQSLLDELGVGKKWRAYMRAHAAEIAPVTGVPVTTPPPPEDIDG
jgi:DNA-binding winged helix-turn-helix (wHTH) protein/tetratricopeptide (TPR) repeat protein